MPTYVQPLSVQPVATYSYYTQQPAYVAPAAVAPYGAYGVRLGATGSSWGHRWMGVLC
jgi:hypothetical protein